MVTSLIAFLESHLATMLIGGDHSDSRPCGLSIDHLISPPGKLPSNHSDSTSVELPDNSFLKPFFEAVY